MPNGEVRCIDDEIPFEIPESWAWCRIVNIASSQLGKTLDRGKEQGNEYPYLCSINVYWEGVDLTKVKTFRLKDDELERYKLTIGDLLICEGGDYGRCSVWDSPIEMYYQNALHRVRFYNNISPYFYKYVVELYRNIGYIKGQGQTIKHFTFDNMKGLLFPVPPLNEQDRIVTSIESLQPIINKYAQAQQELDNLNSEIYDLLKKSILQEAIQGRLVPQNPSDEPATKLLERIRNEKQQLVKQGKLKTKDITDSVIFKGDDNKYYEKCGNAVTCIDDEIPFEIPSNWQWCRLSTLVQITTGKKDANFGDEKGIYDFFTCSNTPLKCKSYSYDGDYLIMPGNGANIGQIIHYTGKFEAYQRTYLLQAYSSFDLEYLKYHLMCNWKEYNQGKLYGSAIPYIKLGNLTAYLVALPPIEEQKRIVTKVNHALASIMSR